MIAKYPTTEEAAGLQAGSALRWLEQSGPRYGDPVRGYVRATTDDCAIIDCDPLIGQRIEVWRRRCTFADWLVIQQAEIGAMVEIRLRIDAAGATR